MYAGKGAVAFSALFTTYRHHQLLSPAQLRPIQLLMLDPSAKAGARELSWEGRLERGRRRLNEQLSLLFSLFAQHHYFSVRPSSFLLRSAWLTFSGAPKTRIRHFFATTTPPSSF